MNENEQVQRAKNPRENANPFSLITFLYTRRLFARGMKKDLEDVDLYEVIKSCRSKKLADKIEHAYDAESKKGNPSSVSLLWKCYGLTYVFLGILNLSFRLLSSALEPNAISHLVGYFKPGQTKLTMQDALYYGGILVGLKLIHSLFFPNYTLYLLEIAIRIRTSLSSLIYRKALKLSPKAFEETSLGNIVTIISKDLSMFEMGMMFLNDIWIGIIQIIYVCYLIYCKVGVSSTVGILILASVIPVQLFVSKIIARLRLKMNGRTDIRLEETQEALSTIKIIKMYTWEKIFADRINETRRKEIKTLLRKAITGGILFVSGDLLGKIGFYAIVMLYIYLSSTVDAESIFYIMRSYLTLKHTISIIFTISFTKIAEMIACLSRVDKVLSLEELPEHVDKPDDDPQIDIRFVTINLRDKDILKNITLKFNAGLNIVTGQLGCGKSSLIKLVLREFPISSGDLRTRGRMSYASQDPWLFPATIKQNILFGEKYEYKRYSRVIDVCALSYDLSILEKGDDTVVQDRGMNLSKGQQARINLARCIYKDSDIYLIDDALTALDPRVQDHIFKECIEGFLKGKLVLLVTHNAKHMAKSENVVILEDGAVKYLGKQQELSKELLQALEEEIHEYPPPTPLPGDEKKLEKLPIEEKESIELTKLIEPSNGKQKQIYHEVKKSGGLSYDVYFSYIKYGGGVLMLILVILLNLGNTFSDSSSQVMLTNWINHISKLSALKEKHFGNTTADIDRLMAAYFPTNSTMNSTGTLADFSSMTNVRQVNPSLTNSISIPQPATYDLPLASHNLPISNQSFYNPVNLSALTAAENETYYLLLEMGKIEIQAAKSINLYTIMLVVSVVIHFFNQYAMYIFCTKASVNIHKHMIKSITYSKMSFFDTFFIGSILNRFSQDLNVVDERLPINLNMLIGTTFAVGGILGMMIHVSWKLLIPFAAILAILILLRIIYMPTARSLKRLEAATRSPIIGYLNSSMEGLTTVRAYKAQDILKEEFDRHQDVYTSAAYTSMCARNAFGFYMDFSATLLIAYIVGRFLFFDTETLAGDVGLTLTQAGGLTLVMQFALMQWSEVENLMTSVERVMEYTKIESETTQGLETPNWPTRGEVTYQDVSLKYTNSNEKVLSNITFKINAREKIGIVGRTGAGKSSIIATLFRLYNHEGRILIDGVDTNTLSLKYLRQHISIIPQDPIIFSGTIRTNIDPSKEFTDEEIWKVLHKVSLDNKIASLSTNCEDTNFSSGERQLLSLARTIIRKNKIVVLDEATANMDPETEQLAQKAIDANFSDCTVFIIAHRLECILDCHKVMVLSRGEILEFDKPSELLKKKDSSFSKMMLVAGAITH